ncbi:nitroreductase family protein [Bacillus methanolicus]|uniref:Nitroreductase n=1 Tax=Bacillus methanolicus (strain MGA3 / ATCC 53907) TaxID=796606 RepID=I3E8R3_BACMM|nr:nitroreductase family protein [Bacillus methanolicus]AIE60149.1 nitroreductase [Bacillus methanolicus MGA3]EIJ82884.1 nitroreductase [Bacillus methanolicus MGA3]UQD52145.1 nitroreductase family protein [Bacillus methanolicus]
MTNIFSIIEERRSVRDFDPEQSISRDELMEILELAGRAPSAWNLQHWHFMVFHGKDVQKKLLPIANNQAHTFESSAVIAVLGDLQADKKIEAVYRPLVESGRISQEIMDRKASQIKGVYQDKTYALAAAHSNASLAAMQLMLAAKGKGWDTCPMVGFDKERFIKEFNVDERYTPVMLIAIGKALKPGRQADRLNIEELITWVK